MPSYPVDSTGRSSSVEDQCGFIEPRPWKLFCFRPHAIRVFENSAENAMSSNESCTFVIERDVPGAGSMSQPQLVALSKKSCAVLDALGPSIQWIHSYVTN